VCSLFRFLRKVLVQDLPLYYDQFPHLSIFNCEHFNRNWQGFQRWHRLQNGIIREVEKVRLQRPPELLSAKSRRLGSLVSLSDEAPQGYIIQPIVGSEKLGYLRKVIFFHFDCDKYCHLRKMTHMLIFLMLQMIRIFYNAFNRPIIL